MSDLLNSASLVMIPSGYKEDVVYSAVPTDGSGDLSFTRASDGTRINSAGLVEVCPWNLADNSNDFGGLSAITKTTGQVSPIDSTSGNLLTATGSGEHYSGIASFTVVVGNSYTYSVYGKFVQSLQLALRTVFSNGDQDIATIFNLSTGVVVSNAGAHLNPTITAVGNGYYRCSITFVPTVVPAFPLLFRLQMALGGNTSFTASSGDSFLAYGAQINNGALAPYFPTTDRLNVPRLTYQNGGGGCPSLLLEKQSTNYMPYSENISLWYAPADGVTLTSNTTDTVSPDGTNNASKIAIVSGSKRSYEITNSVAGVGTFSAYVKAGTSTSITLFTSSGSINIGYNLSTLAITTGSGTGTITSVGNGWYRITATNTLGASEVLQVLYTGTAGQTIYIWGFQVEASSYVTSYIFTNGASATRVADACSKTGISSLIGQTEGVIFCDVNLKVRTAFSYFAINNNGSSGIYVGIYFRTNAIELEVANSGLQASIVYSNSSTGRFKIAAAYKASDFVLYVNGTQIGTYTSGSVPTCNKLDLLAYSQEQPLEYNEAILFPTRLTNAELASLTTI